MNEKFAEFQESFINDLNNTAKKCVDFHNQFTKNGMNKIQWAVYYNFLKCMVDDSVNQILKTDEDMKMYENMYHVVSQLYSKQMESNMKEVKKNVSD